MKLLSLWFAFLMGPRLYFSSNRQSASTTNATTNNDNRVGVGDNGILAGDGANVGNDNRDFTDNSSLSITSTANTSTSNSNNDNRDFSDRSSFNLVSTDNRVSIDARDFSDRSSFSSVDNRVTNITSSDPEVAKAAAEAARRAAAAAEASSLASSEVSREIAARALDTSAALAGSGTKLLESALNYGDAVSARSAESNKTATRDALTFAGSAGQSAFDIVSDVVGKAVSAVTKSAEQDREFAGAFVGKVFETTKSADQQNTEKIVTAGTTVGLAVAAVWGLAKIFGKKS